MRSARLLFVLTTGIASVAGGQSALDTGRRHFEAGELKAAELALAPIGPTNGSAALLLSRIAHRDGRADDAVKWGEQAVRLLPDSARAHVWLGRAYLLKLEQVSMFSKLGLSKRARKEYDRALALDPDDYEVRDARARYFLNAPGIAGGSKDKAREEYAALLRDHPDSAGPFNRLVNLYQASGQFPEAFRLVDQRLARFPGDDPALYQLGKTAAISGERLEQGEAALREFIALGKFTVATEAVTRYRLGTLLEKRGYAPGARREYATAAQLDPKLEDARKALKRLPP